MTFYEYQRDESSSLCVSEAICYGLGELLASRDELLPNIVMFLRRKVVEIYQICLRMVKDVKQDLSNGISNCQSPVEMILTSIS